MDITLPFYNGYHWCQEIRRVSQVPILFLSSASDNINIVMAINMGADDFIAKPFDLSVLLAKVQAALRRAYDYQGQSHLVEHNGALFNSQACTMVYEGKTAELTKNETRLLQVLLEHKPNVVSREDLMAALWACDAYVDENALYVNMTRPREKAGEHRPPRLYRHEKGPGLPGEMKWKKDPTYSWPGCPPTG